MPRLLGVEIPAEKRIEASLTYIYGIGFATARRILEQTNIDPNLRAKNLTPQQLNEIIHAITNNKLKIEGDLRRDVQGHLKRLQAIKKKNGQLLPPRQLRKIFRFQAVTSRSQRSSRRKAARTFIRASRMCFRRSTTQS